MRRRKRILDGLDQDIRDHLERETQDNIDRGMPPDEARSAALRKFGNITRVKTDTREIWSVVWLEQFLQDIRFGIRMLWRTPELTVAAVLAMALGIGVNVGIFSMLNGIALRLLPIPRAEQIVSVNQIFHRRDSRNVHGDTSMFSYSEYLAYRDHNRVFTGLVAYEPFVEATLGGGKVQQLLGAATSCNYFDVLDEHPAEGRGFLESDCTSKGKNAVVVISDDLWRGRFAGDPSLLGQRIILNRTAYTVIGIARPGFGGTEAVPSTFWAPITMQEALEPGRDRLSDDNMSWLSLRGRIRPGVPIEQVRADLAIIAARIDRLHPGRKTSLAVHVATFFGSPEERQTIVPVSSVILAAFGLILLLACANVSNLLLARASVRHREIALREAMGAGRSRLVRQLLTESLLLSLFGGALGSALAFLSLGKFAQFVISHLPRPIPNLAVNVSPDARVFVYALLLTLITGIAFGLLPALQNSRFDLNATLKEGGAQSGSGKGRVLLRDTLVGAQITVSMILLLAAGLLLRGLYHAQTIDPGFETRDVASIFLNFRVQGYDENRATIFMRSMRERIARLPGVTEIAQAECAPLSHDFSADFFTVPGRTARFPIEYNHVSPDYFSVVGIPILRGRGSFALETRDGPGVIVTESTARRLWPGEDPLAKTLREDTGREYSVIGVAKDAQVSHLGELNSNYLYFPAGPEDNWRTYLLIRFDGSFSATAQSLRNIVRLLDPDMLAQVNTLDDYLDVWRAPSRLVALLSGALATLALLLALVGVYGMVSYSVNRNVHEIGIRMALGASGANVLRRVLWRAMSPILIGGLIGVVLCAAVSKVLASLLFGVSAHDAIAFVTVPLFLLIVAAFASFIPARRAMQVDPMIALRFE